MSTTLLAIVCSDDNLLFDPQSVELTDNQGGFGVRRMDTGEVIVASGVPMDNSQPGLWTYEFEDPAEGIYYECAIKATVDGDPYYFTFFRYVPKSTEADSSSESSSESEGLAARSIKLNFSELTREAVADRGDMFRFTISTSDAVNMPAEIFAFLKGPVDPREERDPLEYFRFVATPFDISIYPPNAPDETQTPGFYRKASVEFLAQSTALADEIKESFEVEVRSLFEAYNRLDSLELKGEFKIDEDGIEEVFSEDSQSCEPYVFYDGEQMDRIQLEIAGF
jgi:hypothetical protein